MHTFTTLHSNDLGDLRAYADWDNGTLYLSAKDLAMMLQASIHDCLMEQDTSPDGLTVVKQQTVYFKATAVLQLLSKHPAPRFQKVYEWLRQDILPQYQMPERWWTYFHQDRKVVSPLTNAETMIAAKWVVLDHLNSHRPAHIAPYDLDDVYIVWWCKTLQNWKTLLSTDVVEGVYYEVTYNGDTHETYLDVYQRQQHSVLGGDDQ